MKIYIEQDDVKLSFERAQELDYQTLFKAYQMVTGSDEILEDLSQKEPENTGLVYKIDTKKLAEIEPVNIKAAADKLSAKFSGSTVVSRKPNEKVDADLQCPFCGCAKRWKVPPYFTFMNRPDCQGPIFLSWATGVKGELDDNGFYFRADSPMKFKEQTDEFEDSSRAKVIFDKGMFKLLDIRTEKEVWDNLFDCIENCNVYIQGNIYENKELLEENK